MMRKKIINLMTATLVVALSGVNMYASTEPSTAAGTPRADGTWKSSAVAYGATAFDADNNILYLGAKTTFGAAAVAPYSLAKVTLDADGMAKLTALAPAACVVTDADGPAAVAASPFQKKTNLQIALTPAGLPVVAMKAANGDADAHVYMLSGDADGTAVTKTKDAVIFDGNVGAAPTAVNKTPVALAASDKYIFAAVNKGGVATWGDPTNDQRGIAIIDNQTAGTLKPVQAIAVGTAAEAVADHGARQIIVTAADDALPNGGKIAFKPAAGGITNAELSDGVSMVWDDTLSRLYVGLSGVKRDDPYKEGGVVDILIGDVGARADNVFTLGPIVPEIDKACLYGATDVTKNVDNCFVGFYGDGSTVRATDALNYMRNGYDDIALSARKLHVMHTSTDKSYLILNGVIRRPAVMVQGGLVSQTVNKVCALPLLGTQKWDAGTTSAWSAVAATVAGYVGTLSAVDTDGVALFRGQPATLAAMPRSYRQPIVIGNGFPAVNLQDLYTIGDTVYMFMGGSNNAEAGIFQSTALFNENGIIIGWTPARRVGGDVERAFGGGVNPATGELYFLASLDNTLNAKQPTAYNNQISAPRVTKWGASGAYTAKKMNDAGNDYEARYVSNLSTVLDTYFTADHKLRHIIDFNCLTYGFRQGRFSMAVALSNDKVVLIKTGEWENTMFKPTKNFTAGTNVIDLTTVAATYGDISDLGALCHAAVGYLRSAVAGEEDNKTKGQAWLFVAGYKGVAVLSLTGAAADNGFKNLATLNVGVAGTQAIFPGNTNAWTFKQLGTALADGSSITGVRKLVADYSANGLYVMCDTKIHWIPLHAGNFDTVAHAASLAGAAATTYDLSDAGLTTAGLTTYGIQGLADMVVVNYDAGTNTSTLLVAADTGLFVVTLVNDVLTAIHQALSEPVVHLNYLSTSPRGLPGSAGNVYAMVADYVDDSAKIYRYYVNPSAAAIADVVKAVGTSALVCALPGFSLNVVAEGTMALVTRPYETDLVDYVNLTTKAINTDFAEDMLGQTTAQNVGVPGLNSASGTMTITGDFGVRVNE